MYIRLFKGAFSLFLFFCISAHAEIDPLQIWTASGGEARLELRADYLPDFGLEIVHEGRAAHEVIEVRRAFAESDHLIIAAPYGNFEGFVTGEIRLDTGWVLRHEGREVRLDGLRLRPDVADQGHPKLQVFDGEGRHVLTFSHLHIEAEHERDLLTVHNMDISAGPALPALLDMPVLSELHLGMAWLDMPLQVPEGADTSGLGVDVSDRGLSCTGRPFFPQEYGTHGEVVDVGLIQIGQVAYQGTDGGTGRIKVAPSARLKNLSGGDASWIPKFTTEPFYTYEPRDQHPFLVWNMYRIADGRIQQLGASGVKHAFLTINQSCTINCGSSHVLWPGCEDVYGTGTNDSNGNQGPREDIIASEGLFFSTCSFFDPGCNGSQTNNSTSFQNRLMVDPAQLQTAGADYFLDAWYVVMADHDIWNSMGYHGITPTSSSGGGWSFGPLGPFTNAPLINEWVDPDTTDPNEGHTTVVVPSATPGEPYPDNLPQGHIKVLVKVTEPQTGRYRYNYAVQNFDFDRGVEAFRVPISESAQIFETWFGGIDGEPGDDWTITVEDGFVNFEAPANNPLGWFKLFNFEIETDMPPIASTVTLDLGGDAVVPSMDADILGPDTAVQGEPALVIQPGNLDFGDLLAGTSEDLDISLENTGDATLEISALELPGAPYGVDAGDCGGSSFDLEPGGSCVLTVTFAPAAEGEFTDELTIESNATGSPHTVTLAGTGFVPPPGELEVAPESLDFGEVVEADTGTAIVTLSNVAAEGATALSLDMVGTITGGEAFEIVGNDCGATLEAQASCELEVQFAPAAPTAYSGILRIVADGGTVNISLTGAGVVLIPKIFDDRFESVMLTSSWWARL